ncbi:MAG TPA: PP2C family protein-serine/threonine phosphatase [Abditibacterium sp.]|jgi:hypothetical protein
MSPWKRAAPFKTPAIVPDFLDRDDIKDAELILTAFRSLLLLVLFLAPFWFESQRPASGQGLWLLGLAATYNLAMGIASLYPSRLGVRRPLILAMDSLLIAVWIHLTRRWELMSFYYVIVVVAAMWYRVLGGILAAAICDFSFLFLWGRVAADSQLFRPPAFTGSMAINTVLLFVVGTLTGYLAEAQERERERRLERELLIANYEQEIDVSTHLQPLLMARFGHHECLDLGAALQSARAVGGGDYLDAFPLPDGRILLCIADVSGKSARAQAQVPLLKYALRALAPLHSDLSELTRQLQGSLVLDLPPELYIALCLVVIDCGAEELCWCNAGHMAPLRVRPADAPEGPVSIAPLETTMPALGLFPEIEPQARQLPWQPGDALLFFTDGLADALSFGGAVDGEGQVQKLAARLGQAAPLPAQTAAQELVDIATSALDEKPAGAKPARLSERISAQVHRDDIAVLVARFKL